MRGRVLVVDDDPAMTEVLVAGLRVREFDPVGKPGVEDAIEALRSGEFDVVLTDLLMRGPSGIDLCRRIAENRPDVPVLVMTAFGSLDSAIAAIRAGAYDFLTKPVELDSLALALDRAVQHRALREEVKRLRRESGSVSFGDIVGQSSAIREMLELLDRIADTDSSVLITGESGTGKELVAKALHAKSRRRAKPFVAVNCAAVPEALLESELFGHAKGAFTDAKVARRGLFMEAGGGTLFLDEIGEMPLSTQPKLLRALQERTARPVGGLEEIPFDVRIVTATNRDLEADVESGKFREDLLYRLNVIPVHVPPLRSRGNDVLLLAQRFVEQFAAKTRKSVHGLSAAAGEKLLAYAWPGNVRELQNCIERAVALARFDELAVDDLSEKVRDYRRSHVLLVADDPSELVPLDEIERRYILKVLEAMGGNKTLAAQALKLDRKTLYRKLERYGVL